MLLVALGLPAGREAARAQQAEPIAGLEGRLAVVSGELYAFSLTAADGQLYALLAAQPAVDQQLNGMALAAPWVTVSGTLQRVNPLTSLPLVVVETLQMLDEPAATPVAPLPTPTVGFGVPEEPIGPVGTPAARPTSDPAATPVPDDGLKATPAPTALATPPVTATVAGTAPVPTIPAPTVPVATVPAATATRAPAVRLAATVNVFALNLRKGPDGEYAIAGTVREGDLCAAVGRAAPDWLLLECAAATGWARAHFVQVQGDLNLLALIAVAPPDVAESATPSSEPPFSWRALLYPNRTLSGAPVVGFDTPLIDFDWGLDAPVAGMPVDNFSLRFDAAPRFAPGDYLFTLTYDDGARLIVNDRVVISDWNEGGARSSTWQGRLAGIVPVRVEFFEAYHQALVRLQIERVVALLPEPTPQPSPVPPGVLPPALLPEGSWRAEYFTNAERAGPATLARQEPADDAGGAAVPLISARTPLERDWGASSPAPAVLGLDGWSARWQGRFRFAAGAQELVLTGSGSAWVWLDGILVAAGELSDAGVARAEISVAGGWRTLAVEFATGAERAAITLGWRALDAGEDEQVPADATATPRPAPTAAATRAPGLPPLPTPTPAPTPLATPTLPGK